MNTKLQNFTNTLSNLFLLCLGLLAFQSIFGQAIFGFNMADYGIGSFLLGFIQKTQYLLVILAIVFGSLVFYSNREEVDSLEEEKMEEELEEEKRKKEFEEKWSRLNRVPVIGCIFKWFYKEGIKLIIILSLIIINGFFLRFTNLDILPLQNDEFLTQLAVESVFTQNLGIKDFLLSASDNFSSDKFYSRAWPYTLSIVGITSILGGDYNSIFNLRIISVIFGTLFLIFSYIILKKYRINKKIILLTIFGLSINFILIYYSRESRMYSLFVLYYFVLFSYLYNIIQILLKENNILLFFKKNYIKFIILLVLTYIGIIIHLNILTVYMFIMTYILYKAYILKRKDLITLMLLPIIFFITINFTGIFELVPARYFNTTGKPNYKFIFEILSNFENTSIGMVFIILGFLYSLITKNDFYKFIVFYFIIIFFYFLLAVNGKQFHDPRYFIFLHPIIIFIVSFIFYYLGKIIIKNKVQKISYIIILFAGLFSIQISNINIQAGIIKTPTNHESRIFNIDKWNYDYDLIYRTIKNNFDKNSLLVTRSNYPFYSKKYGINENQIISLLLEKKDINLLKDKTIIFVLYNSLYYQSYNTKENNDIYNYLLNLDKIEILNWNNGKVIVYKIKNR